MDAHYCKLKNGVEYFRCKKRVSVFDFLNDCVGEGQRISVINSEGPLANFKFQNTSKSAISNEIGSKEIKYFKYNYEKVDNGNPEVIIAV